MSLTCNLSERERSFTVPLHAAVACVLKSLMHGHGAPIVSTSIAEGIQIETGVNVLIADEPVAFAQQSSGCWNRETLREAPTCRSTNVGESVRLATNLS